MKRRRPIATTTFTKEWFERRGFYIAYVQRTVITPSRIPINFDAFGFADHFAFKTGRSGMIAVNSCAIKHLPAHFRKYTDRTCVNRKGKRVENRTAQVLKAFLSVPGNRFFMFGWERGRKRGAPPRLRIDEISNVMAILCCEQDVEVK